MSPGGQSDLDGKAEAQRGIKDFVQGHLTHSQQGPSFCTRKALSNSNGVGFCGNIANLCCSGCRSGWVNREACRVITVPEVKVMCTAVCNTAICANTTMWEEGRYPLLHTRQVWGMEIGQTILTEHRNNVSSVPRSTKCQQTLTDPIY